MNKEKSNVVKNAFSELNRIMNEEEKVPFLKTCPKCNNPLRAGENISVVMESFNSKQFTNVSYYCCKHSPDLENIDKILTCYSVLIDIQIVEPHPDCRPSERDVQIKDYSYKRPESYNI